MKVKSIQSKSILTKSKLPGADYVINPYTGCSFACSYCYAAFIGKFSGHNDEEWGDYVDVKENAPELLGKEILKLKNKLARDIFSNVKILIGSITDPYQGPEAKYKITRKCLGVLVDLEVDCQISILTKSHLITRDIDLLRRLNNFEAGMTITTTSDSVSRLLECKAPSSSLRLNALKKLNESGIKTYVCINPLLPHFCNNEKQLRKLFNAISDAGTKRIWLEHLNLSGKKRNRLKEILKQNNADLVPYFLDSQSEEYKSELNSLIFNVLDDFDFTIEGGGIVDHKSKTITDKNGSQDIF